VFLAAVLRWRIGPVTTLRGVVSRVGLLLTVNAMVLLTAAVILNDIYGFYADWTDLFGAMKGSAPGSTLLAGGSASAAMRGMGRSRVGKISDALLVMPTVEVPTGRDTECLNAQAGDSQVETWVTKDVPAWVERTFRVRADRTSWAVVGLSAGSWCAAMAAMLHSGQYAAAISLGGYFRPQFGNWPPFLPGSSQYRRYDLIALAHDRPVQWQSGSRPRIPTGSRIPPHEPSSPPCDRRCPSRPTSSTTQDTASAFGKASSTGCLIDSAAPFPGSA
jgi:hypothetical protein